MPCSAVRLSGWQRSAVEKRCRALARCHAGIASFIIALLAVGAVDVLGGAATPCQPCLRALVSLVFPSPAVPEGSVGQPGMACVAGRDWEGQLSDRPGCRWWRWRPSAVAAAGVYAAQWDVNSIDDGMLMFNMLQLAVLQCMHQLGRNDKKW